MATVFNWTGKGAKGAIVKGELTAGSKEEVEAYLRKQRIMPTKISPKSKPLFNMGPKVTEKDLVIFTRQFATMIGAGLPLIQALEILAKQTRHLRP
jgi:type IV pilus assembly protein PilC